MHGQGRMTRLVPALLVGAMLALVAAGSVAGGAPAAHKAAKSHHPPGGGDCDGGRGIPDGKIGIQLFNFAAYIGFGSDAATQARLEEVLRRLSEIGYRNVEPFTFNGLTAAQFRALLDRYHLKAPARHGSVAISTFASTLADSRVLGQKYVGSGGFPAPGIGGSLENVLATAIVMDELGRRSVRNGTGKFYGHNHQGEFRTTYTDPVTGEVKPAWQFLVENTDPRYVAFELDVLWATDGGADPVALLNRYGEPDQDAPHQGRHQRRRPGQRDARADGSGGDGLPPDPGGRPASRRLLLLRAGSAVRGSGVRSVRQRSGGVHLPRLLPVLSRMQEILDRRLWRRSVDLLQVYRCNTGTLLLELWQNRCILAQ